MNAYFPEVIELDIQKLIEIGLMGLATISLSQLPCNCASPSCLITKIIHNSDI